MKWFKGRKERETSIEDLELEGNELLKEVEDKVKYINLPLKNDWIEQFNRLILEQRETIEEQLVKKIENVTVGINKEEWKLKINQFITHLVKKDKVNFLQNQKPIVQLLLDSKMQPELLMGAGEIVLDHVIDSLIKNSNWSKESQKIKFFQKWMMLHQMTWIELYTKEVVTTFSHGISELVFYNAQIDQVKDLLTSLDHQLNFSKDIQHMVKEVNKSFEEVASASNSAADFTAQSVNEVRSGQKVINEALQEMGTLDDTYNRMIEGMNEFSQKIHDMQSMVDLIRDIADQTNLLALNANIEAARAGEQGLGFAVVAQEVRKLSETSRTSVDKISEMMDGLTKESERMKDWMKQTGDVVHKGVYESTQASSQLETMVTKINQINVSINEIAAANEEQSASIQQVADQNEKIVLLANDGRDKGVSTGKAIYQLSLMSQELRKSIDQIGIKVTEKELLNLAKTDHLLWKWRIYNMLLGYEVVDAHSIQNEQECRLGKWYYNEGRAYQHLEIYRQMEHPHQMVHLTARQAAEAYARKDIAMAEAKLQELEKYSTEIINLLDTIQNTIKE